MHKNKRDSLTPRAEQIIKNEKLLFTCCKNKKKIFFGVHGNKTRMRRTFILLSFPTTDDHAT